MKYRDTAGQEIYDSLNRLYYQGANAAILVYDITNLASFKKLDFWVKELKNNAKCEDMTIAIAANKIDLVDQEKISLDRGKNYAQKNEAFFIQTSAKENHNIEKLFYTIAQKVLPSLKEKLAQSAAVLNSS
jgi:small GTP-binding protein